MSKIGFIGTGVMGKSIIRNMMKNNLSVNVYNRTKSKTDDLVAEGAVWYDTPKAIAEASDIIFTMVGFPSDVEGVYFNETGIFQADLTGKIVVDLTTSTPTLAEKIAKKAAEV
ncbi:MAG: NAD(P)-binding domain-containing protein, partial [Enterococcus faecalis]|nr:NAD(P)-binding domain-containing protein [Enterococcus faecalis]